MIMKSLPFNSETSNKSRDRNPATNVTGAMTKSSFEPKEQLLVLSQLANASKYANDSGKNIWDFAVELGVFTKQGVSHLLLRWLVSQRVIEHRYEAKTAFGERRQFFEAPDSALNDRSCFAISEGGHETFDRLKQMVQMNSFDSSDVEMGVGEQMEIPVWCPITRVLKIAGKVVKHFKWPAPNQEKLINAFAEQGWPTRLDDPLPPNGVCPKRRLHDTIKCLNRNQINKLIKFRGDGTAQGACWEYRPEKSDNQ